LLPAPSNSSGNTYHIRPSTYCNVAGPSRR
jgi:hypothetical protein